jgi:hypothetical protein
MTRPNRFLLILFLVLLLLGGSWVIVSKLVVPLLIERAYHGQSLAFINHLISGQTVHSVEHYLTVWNRIYQAIMLILLVGLLVVGLVLFITSRLKIESLDTSIQKNKVALLGVSLAYISAAHYLYLGFTTWDGFTYRIPPIVELVQHGNLGGEKFDFYVAQHFYPFFELLHYPFLKLFGLPGLFFSFPLLLFPLTIVAIYWFVKEITGDQGWAAYSTLAYISIPFINEQPFAGYVDFAVVGAAAFFLFALLKVLRAEQPSRWSWALFLAATFVFSMSRQHTPYIAIFLFGAVTVWLLLPCKTRAIRAPFSRLPLLGFIFALGMAPSVYLHVHRFLQFGTPIYPFQFKFLGLETAAGLPLQETLIGAGLQVPTWRGMLSNFAYAWLFPTGGQPLFFDSRFMGAGLFLWIGLIAFPVIRKRVNWDLGFILLLLIGTTLIVQDFWLPRYSFSLVLVILLCVGGALSRLATKGPHWAYATLFVLSVLHLIGRPVCVAAEISLFDRPYYRANLFDSPWFIQGPANVEAAMAVYPDWNADLLIVYPMRPFRFVLPLYGRHLSNQIIGKLEPSMLRDSCAPLRDLAGRSLRKVLVVDQSGRLGDECEWICELSGPSGCMAQRLAPNHSNNGNSARIGSGEKVIKDDAARRTTS